MRAVTAITILSATLALCASRCGGDVVVTPHGGNSYTVSGQLLTLKWDTSGEFLLKWNADSTWFGRLSPSGGWPYTYDAASGDSGKTMSRLSVGVSAQGSYADVTELWSVAYGGSERYRLQLVYRLWDAKPYFRVRVSVVNSGVIARQIALFLRVTPDALYGAPNRAVAFHQRLDLYPLDFGLGSLSAAWGQREFAVDYAMQSLTGSDLFLPVVCAYSTSRQGGPVMMCEPRNWFAFQATTTNLGVNRWFWVPSGAGQSDSTIDVKDGTGPVPYDVYVGYCPSPHWSKLYWDYYVDAFPRVAETEQTPLPSLPFAGSGGNPPVFNAALANTQISFGVKTFSGGNPLLQVDPQEVNNQLGGLVSIAHQTGRKAIMGITHGMAVDMARPDAGYYDPSFDYRNYTADLVHWQSSSDPTPAWVGYRVNPSLDAPFRFQQDLFTKIQNWFDSYGYDGLFLDYYIDTVNNDWAHTYQQFPFYPLQVSYTQFARASSDWLHARGKSLWINYPHPSMQAILGRFADAVSYDGSIWQNGFWWKIASGANGQPVQSLFNPSGGNAWASWRAAEVDPGLFFGTDFSPWNWQIYGLNTPYYLADQETARFKFASNSALGGYLACSRLMTGDPQLNETKGQRLFYRHSNGTVFATVRNLNKSLSLNGLVIFDTVRLGLQNSTYSVWVWDVDEGLSLLLDNVPGATLAAGVICPSVPPGSVKVLVVAPYASSEIVDLGFSKYVRPMDRGIECSSPVSGVSWDPSGSRLSFTATALAGVRSAAIVHLPTGVKPTVSVSGAATFSAQMLGQTLGIIVNHSTAAATVQVSSIATSATPMGVIKGTVRSLLNLSPIAGVTVSLNTGQSVTTGASGTFEIQTLPGSYTLTTSRPGYSPSSASVSALEAGQVVTRDFAITPYQDLSTGPLWSGASRYSIEAFASDSDGSNPAENAFNNNAGDAWVSSSAGAQHWLMVDLGQTRTVSGVATIGLSASDSAPQAYRIQAGGAAADPYAPETSADWQDLVVVTGGSQASVNQAWGFEPVACQRVRMYCSTPPADGHVRVRELMVYGGAAGTCYPLGGNSHPMDSGVGYLLQDGPQYALDGDSSSLAGTFYQGYSRAYYVIGLRPGLNVRQVFMEFGKLRPYVCPRFRVQAGGPQADPEQPENGADWTTLASFAGNYELSRLIEVPEGVRCQRLRIYCPVSNTQLSLENIQVFGTADDGESPESIGEARALSAGAPFSLGARPVTARFADRFYIEEPDRSSGVMVAGAYPVEAGDLVSISGAMGAKGVEQCIHPTFVRITSRNGSPPAPLVVAGSLVGSGRSGRGLATTGLLVEAWGRVLISGAAMAIDPGDGQLLVDASGLSASPSEGVFLKIRGISCLDESGQPLLRARGDADVVIIN